MQLNLDLPFPLIRYRQNKQPQIKVTAAPHSILNAGQEIFLFILIEGAVPSNRHSLQPCTRAVFGSVRRRSLQFAYGIHVGSTRAATLPRRMTSAAYQAVARSRVVPELLDARQVTLSLTVALPYT